MLRGPLYPDGLQSHLRAYAMARVSFKRKIGRQLYTTSRANSPASCRPSCLHLKKQSYFSLWGESLSVQGMTFGRSTVRACYLRQSCAQYTFCFKQIHFQAALGEGRAEKGTIILIVIHKYDLELPAVHITHFCITRADRMITRVLLGEHLGPDQEKRRLFELKSR